MEAAWFHPRGMGLSSLSKNCGFGACALMLHGLYKTIGSKQEEFTPASTLCSCGRYFYIPARKEHRGVGGIFYDDMATRCEAWSVRGWEGAGRMVCRALHGLQGLACVGVRGRWMGRPSCTSSY